MTIPKCVPDRPRLRTGCRAFEDKNRLILRGTGGAVEVAPGHRAALSRIVERLDGRCDLDQALHDVSASDGFYALRLMSVLAQAGLLLDGPWQEQPGENPEVGDRGFAGVKIVCVGEGRLATRLSVLLQGSGADVQKRTFQAAQDEQALALVCPDGPDLHLMEKCNWIAQKGSAPWMAVLPLGDSLLVGPLLGSGGNPCFRCLELRWLSISPSRELEEAYFRHCRRPDALLAQQLNVEHAEYAAALAAPLLRRLLIGSNRGADIVLTSLETAESTWGQLRSFPLCEVCGAEQRKLTLPVPVPTTWDDQPLSLEQLALRLLPFADQPCGLAWLSPELKGDGTAPTPFVVAVARFADPDTGVSGAQQYYWCHGSGPTAEHARTIAVVEALERYSGLSTPPLSVVASFNDIHAEALCPTELVLFSDSQYQQPGFRFEHFQSDQILRWNYGYDLTARKTILVPTSAAWYGYHDHILGESSNGVAAHSSRGHALLNGIYELVERDAFMLHWLNRLAPPRVDINEIASDRERDLLERVMSKGYEVHILDMTTDLEIPAVVVLATREDKLRPALILGAGCSIDFSSALLRAVNEIYAATFAVGDSWRCGPSRNVKEIADFVDQSMAYEHPDWLKYADFLWSSERLTAPQNNQVKMTWSGQLEAITKKLYKKGHHVIGVDITAPELRSSGLSVVRAIVPGLQPLALSAGPRLGGSRLFQAPVRMGYMQTPLEESDLNRTPHCFP